MKIKITRFTYSFILLFGLSGYIQANQFSEIKRLTIKNQPISYQIKGKLLPATKILANKPNLKSIQAEDIKRSLEDLPYRFAIPVKSNLDFTQQGVWTEYGDKSIWRLNVSGEHVQSFNIGLKGVFLPQGAKLFFYSDNFNSLVGPYTHKDNKSHRELWSPVIESNSVTIEINVPTQYKSLVKFRVATISQGYRSIRSSEMAKSGSCNNDVVCSEANPWQNEIRSVARYTITVGASSFFCTGTLINNVEENLTPYFLTAGHCGVDSTTAASITAYWNYETSVCQGTPDGQLTQFQNGMSYLGGTDSTGVGGSDFALAQFDTTPDASFNVYWAGWDNSSNAPSSAVGIHHPAGDEKRISFDNDSLTITNYASSMADANGTHLMVGAWEDGTTEGGSSGSGIWNENHHLVGTLSGGGASCQALDQPDWYGRFATHWLGDGTNEGQLRVWLDPNDTGAITLDGQNACDAPIVNITTASATGNMGEPLSFSASVTGGTGPYTYSWDFNRDFIEETSEESPSYTYNYLYQGNIRLTATDATGCLGGDTSAIVISNSGDELFMAEGQIHAGWAQSTGSDASWIPNTVEVFDGATSLASQAVVDNQSSAIEVTQTFQGDGNFVAFAYKVSSERGFDKLNFSVDGVVKGSWSGEVDWGTAYFPLDTGMHTLKWSYDKDFSVSEGQDKAWIDGVTGIFLESSNNNQAPTASTAVASINVNENVSVTLDASNSTDPDGDTLSFTWVQTGGTNVSLTGANTAIATFTAPSVSANIQLVFSVTVSDPSGAQSVMNVTVSVADVPVVTPPEGDDSGGGSFGSFLLLLLMLTKRKRLQR